MAVGAHETVVTTSQDVLTLIQQGTRHRSTGKTDMNKHSSRSHALVTLFVEKRIKESASARVYQSQISRINLVDLAGSESLQRSGSDRLQETVSINSGLLVLDRVVTALINGMSMCA